MGAAKHHTLMEKVLALRFVGMMQRCNEEELMPDYNDLPNSLPLAKAKFQIPDWFVSYTIIDRWSNYTETTRIDPEKTEIVLEKRYSHQDRNCYMIITYCVYDWHITTRTGTLQKILQIDMQAVMEVLAEITRFMSKKTLGAMGDYADPSYQTAGGLIDLALVFKGLPFAQLFGTLGQFYSINELMDSLEEIAEKVMAANAAIQRLIRADGSVVATYENVVWEHKWERKLTYSSVEEIVEVECQDWILKLEEGQVIHVPEHDKWLYPNIPEEGSVESELDKIRRHFGDR